MADRGPTGGKDRRTTHLKTTKSRGSSHLTKIPGVPSDLVAWLQSQYQDTFPTIVGADPMSLARREGQLHVVRQLAKMLEDQKR
jgi:hypothetical protein